MENKEFTKKIKKRVKIFKEFLEDFENNKNKKDQQSKKMLKNLECFFKNTFDVDFLKNKIPESLNFVISDLIDFFDFFEDYDVTLEHAPADSLFKKNMYKFDNFVYDFLENHQSKAITVARAVALTLHFSAPREPTDSCFLRDRFNKSPQSLVYYYYDDALPEVFFDFF